MENTTTAKINHNNTGTTSNYNMWSNPERVVVHEYSDRIEMVYKQFAMTTFTTGFYNTPQEVRVFKIVFSCVDGKWNKSEPIYGKIIAAQEESYEFED